MNEFFEPLGGEFEIRNIWDLYVCDGDANQTMNFAEALEKLLDGKRVSRTSFSNIHFITKQKGYEDGIPINRNTSEATGLTEGTIIRVAPYLCAMLPNKTIVPWQPTQEDIFANDWYEYL